MSGTAAHAVVSFPADALAGHMVYFAAVTLPIRDLVIRVRLLLFAGVLRVVFAYDLTLLVLAERLD
jgi:hypothetical protein